MDKWEISKEIDHMTSDLRTFRLMLTGEITYIEAGEVSIEIKKIERLARGKWVDRTDRYSDRAKANFADVLYLQYQDEKAYEQSGLPLPSHEP